MDTNRNNSSEITYAPCGHPTHRGHEVSDLGMVECQDCVDDTMRRHCWLRERERLGVDDSLPFVMTDHAWSRREMQSSYRAIVLFVLMGLAALAALVVLR